MQTASIAETKTPAWLEIVRQKVGTLRFGVVQVVVHENRVVQIERTERVRLDREDTGIAPLDTDSPTRTLEAEKNPARLTATTGGSR